MNEFSYQERHMGTDVSLSFVCPERTYADQIAKAVYDIVTQYEQEFSRFLPHSALSTLNKTGQLTISDRFDSVLKTSLALHRQTNGVFNPLVQVATLGYDTTFVDISNRTLSNPPPYNTDIDQLQFSDNAKTLQLAPGQQLDFGGILKGYLATELANKVMNTYPKCTGCIINIGGDLATRGTDPLHEPFIFMLYNPVTGSEVPVALTDTSLATSGTYARQWQTNAGIRNHIVDVTSQQNPTSDVTAVSIIHPDGATAEALTKLFIITGIDKATKLTPPKQHEYQYFCITKNGLTHTNIV